MATTAIGTLIPILRDKGELQTRFCTYLLGAGAVGEFGRSSWSRSSSPPTTRSGRR